MVFLYLPKEALCAQLEEGNHYYRFSDGARTCKLLSPVMRNRLSHHVKIFMFKLSKGCRSVISRWHLFVEQRHVTDKL